MKDLSKVLLSEGKNTDDLAEMLRALDDGDGDAEYS
jgi:hypothetical protein